MESATQVASQDAMGYTESSEPVQRAVWLGSGSLMVASIEALCAFLLVLSKFGLLVAFTSFLSSVIISRYHADWVRVPVLSAAFVSAAINVFVLWNWNRLRKAPAAAWRKRRLSVRQQWRVAVVIVTSVATIALVVAEFCIHPIHLHL